MIKALFISFHLFSRVLVKKNPKKSNRVILVIEKFGVNIVFLINFKKKNMKKSLEKEKKCINQQS